MPNYIVNTQPQTQTTVEHEVHETTCSHLPSSWNQHSLGWCVGCAEAVRAAKTVYPTADSCYVSAMIPWDLLLPRHLPVQP